MEKPLLVLFSVAFCGTVLATPVAELGARLGLVDSPDARKLQTVPVPRTGGIGILIGLGLGLALLIEFAGALGVPLRQEALAIVVGAVLIHLTGLLDDLLDLSADVKLFAQATCVTVVVSQGLLIERVNLPGGGVWEAGTLAVPLTYFFLLGLVNSINFMDGLDGLAGGIVAIAAGALAVTGILEGNLPLAAGAVLVLAATCGFLPFNFVARKTFLGDGGSMLLGFLLGVLALSGASFQGSSTPLFILVFASSVPIFDTATTILRRFRGRSGIFRPDSMHVHHRFLRSGVGVGPTVRIIHAMSAAASGLALALFVDGGLPFLVVTAAAILLVAVELRAVPPRPAAGESSAGEILFYLLGAQEGAARHHRGEIAILDVLEARGESGELERVERPDAEKTKTAAR